MSLRGDDDVNQDNHAPFELQIVLKWVKLYRSNICYFLFVTNNGVQNN